jgi:hypothetical protein
MPVSSIVKCTLLDVAMLSLCLVAARRHSWKDAVVAWKRRWGVMLESELFKSEARDLTVGNARCLYNKREGACIVPIQQIKREGQMTQGSLSTVVLMCITNRAFRSEKLLHFAGYLVFPMASKVRRAVM